MECNEDTVTALQQFANREFLLSIAMGMKKFYLGKRQPSLLQNLDTGYFSKTAGEENIGQTHHFVLKSLSSKRDIKNYYIIYFIFPNTSHHLVWLLLDIIQIFMIGSATHINI